MFKFVMGALCAALAAATNEQTIMTIDESNYYFSGKILSSSKPETNPGASNKMSVSVSNINDGDDLGFMMCAKFWMSKADITNGNPSTVGGDNDFSWGLNFRPKSPK